MQQVLSAHTFSNILTCYICVPTVGLLKQRAKIQAGDTALNDKVLREIIVMRQPHLCFVASACACIVWVLFHTG